MFFDLRIMVPDVPEIFLPGRCSSIPLPSNRRRGFSFFKIAYSD
jgi:hypothetical protein